MDVIDQKLFQILRSILPMRSYLNNSHIFTRTDASPFNCWVLLPQKCHHVKHLFIFGKDHIINLLQLKLR